MLTSNSIAPMPDTHEAAADWVARSVFPNNEASQASARGIYECQRGMYPADDVKSVVAKTLDSIAQALKGHATPA